jgi:peptidoglycan/xylan/chitin deacetylase (PgdA/CDA1 family)
MSSDPGAVFLMYHELELAGRQLCQSDPGYIRYILSAGEFSRQMRLVRELGLRGSSVSEALNFSSPAIAITFDDGCETDLISAAPVLQELGFGATFFVVTGWIGKPGFLSKSQLRELARSGFEIGCHSRTHAYLSDLDDAGLQIEIGQAKVELEQMLGLPVEHFSCPGGRYDSRVSLTAMSSGYRTVSTSIPRINSPAADKFSLGRVAVTRDIDSSAFQRMCRGESLWTLALRSRVRDRAKSLMGNRVYDRVRALLLK